MGPEGKDYAMSVSVGVSATGGTEPMPDAVKLEPTENTPPAASPRRSAIKREPHTTPPRASRPRRAPELISCRDLGKYVDGVDSEVLQREAEAARSERKSKTQALSAMARGAIDGASDASSTGPSAQRHATRKAARMPRLPPLVYDYMNAAQADGAPAPIATSATTPRHVSRTQPRVFGLEEAPTFYPTWDEFQDPLQYIEWTASPSGGNGVEYGIVKIVPPEGWKMDFVADEQTFRFRTRVQRLNELSAEGRVSQNYREQLEQFHAQQGHGKVNVPFLHGRALDLHALKRAAQAAHAGAASSGPEWPAVAEAMGYDEAHAATLKNVYARLIAPFEEYLVHAKGRRPTAPVPTAPVDDTACDVCRVSDNEARVQCSDCEKHFHLGCLTPPLAHAPRGDWVCSACLVGTGGDFGFDDGETHSLHSFWQRCAAFQRAWAARASKHGAPEDAEKWARLPTRSNADATLLEDEDLIEAEFWRLVHSTQELVDVEYGADVHSSTHGNAAPTMERQPLNPYARSGWNLNNLPILPASLLRYIKSEISGMTVPWIYLGMMFSAFCWHNEDHYTYSVNYQHWGATKTWYGVPGADAAKFEAAMQRIAPQLFEACPDLLLQLVTMMSPELSRAEGVRTYACNQRPNEFVITFPKAYHSGFNHGFNLNEAVNFALPDWVMDGLACAQRYQTFARQPVFSHDELLVTIALHNQQLSTAVWLQSAYRDMVDREMQARAALRAQNIAEELVEHDRPEAEYQCAHCKTLCYLAQVTARDTKEVACLAHPSEVFSCDKDQWTLRLRFPDNYLETQATKLSERASIPQSWQDRVQKLLIQHPRPPLRTLRTLVQEGEKIAFPMPEMAQLQTFLERATPWVQRAQVFLSRRQKRGENAPKRRGRAREPSPPPPESTQDRSPEALLRLCAEVPSLPFEAPEFASLEGVVEQMAVFTRDSATFLALDPQASDAHHRIDDAERVLDQGALLQVDVPEVEALRRWIAHAKWFSELDDIGEKFLTLEEVNELLTEAEQAGIDVRLPQVQSLLQRRQRGEEWGVAALALLDGTHVFERSAIDELLDVPANVATSSEVRGRATALQHKAAQWHEVVTDIYNHTHPSPQVLQTTTEEPARLSEARQVLADAAEARIELPFAKDLAEGIALHDRWNKELAGILRKAHPKAKGGDPVELARRFCEHTRNAAAANALTEWEQYTAFQKEKVRAEEQQRTDAVANGGAKMEDGDAPVSQNGTSEAAVPPTEQPAVAPEPQAVQPESQPAQAEVHPAQPAPEPASQPSQPASQPVQPSASQPESSSAPEAAPQLEPQTAPQPERQPGHPPTQQPEPQPSQPEPKAEPEPVPSDPQPAEPVLPNGTHHTTTAPSGSSESGTPGLAEPATTSTQPAAADETPPEPPAPAPCICFEKSRERTVTCKTCEMPFHLKCLDLRPKGLGRQWQCPFCDTSKLLPLLQTRHAVSQLPLVALLQNAAFQRDKFRFLPSNYTALQAAIRATVEFGVAVTMRFRHGALPSELVNEPRSDKVEITPLIREVTRRAIGCPVDVLLIADATPKQNVPSVLDALIPAFHLQREVKEAKPEAPKAPEAPPKAPARRSKRARLTFREEKPPTPQGDVPVHCFCGQPDTGTMVQCDKCSLWFHNACMYIDDPESLQEKWFCPVCCLRLRRRYPHAEVRIQDATPTAPQPPVPPNFFVDLPASLRSETKPVNRMQHWTNERRIVLHLVHFEPAVLVQSEKTSEPAQEPPAKRVKLSPEHDRHLQGRINLLRRGVSDAMMNRYAMGWNGDAIVCQLSPDRQVVLGPTIRLAPDDLDGTRLLRMALEAAWQRPEVRDGPYRPESEPQLPMRPQERYAPGVPIARPPMSFPSERPTSIPPGERPISIPPGERPMTLPPGERPMTIPPGERPMTIPPGERAVPRPMNLPMPPGERPMGFAGAPHLPIDRPGYVRDPVRNPLLHDEVRRSSLSPREELRRPILPPPGPMPGLGGDDARRAAPLPLPARLPEGMPFPRPPPRWHP
ncbi:uncharacterized protein MJAP1_000571 [Malassezia japonica]|uniref:[histone H3]-trimethyl-L-lysine(4) demethylase n=1 Tax=Malassezia japonica TaxID=223818 RepID=A0AAF0F068_9BASI|nr:uncharacterized protein MJAP1_000571 [Malassezia japonica]WFD37624.1 hypothetical protein MJAP1_000571 [Malassezia japonica]